MRILRVVVLSWLFVPAVVLAEASRFGGLWQGTVAREGRAQSVALVCRPRGASGMAGGFYLDGGEFGPIEDARATGDSLTFHSGPYLFEAALTGDSLDLVLIVPHGRTHRMTLARTSVDTLAAPSPAAAAPNTVAPKIPRAPDAVYRAHDLPPEATSSTHPCLRAGTLLLVGGGAGQDDLNARFLALAGGLSARILDLPDASMALQGLSAPPDGQALARLIGARHVEVIHATSREQADADEFVRPLREANALWIDGGEAEAIVDRYMGTRTEQEMIALLARGGVIGGTSAGALIWGSRCMIMRDSAAAHPYQGIRAEDLKPGDPHEPAFGLLRNVTVVPHYAEFGMQAAVLRMVRTHPGLLAIGIDEATALEVHGDVGTVLGRGHVTVFDGQDHAGQPFLVLSAGARYDIRRRAVR